MLLSCGSRTFVKWKDKLLTKASKYANSMSFNIIEDRDEERNIPVEYLELAAQMSPAPPRGGMRA